MSHDLRGPLGNAENLLALVIDGDAADPGNRLLLLRAQVNIRRVSSLVTNLLQAAAMKTGELALQLTPVQLNDIVDEVFTLEGGAALLRNITFAKELDAHLPLVTVDFIQASRMVSNLVSNALKYTNPEGRVVVRTTSDAEHVRVSVQDTGMGMNAEQCKALFAPYRRVHLGGSAPGTGLGLYIVRRLAEAQGASVSVTSEVGKGSTFVIAFPRTGRLENARSLTRGTVAVARAAAATAHAA